MSEISKLQIQGHPVASFEFIGLPSVNTHYGLNRWTKATRTAEWRYEARVSVLTYRGLEDDDLFLAQMVPIIQKRALVVVWVFPPYEEISDIHNIYIKAVLDGFSDAGLWQDDEWASVPLVLYAFGGIGEQKPRTQKKRLTRFDIYEIGMFTVRDKIHNLPRGRKRLK